MDKAEQGRKDAATAQSIRESIHKLPDYKLLELREWLCTLANVESVVNHRTQEPNVLDLYELQEFGSEFLAVFDGTEEYTNDRRVIAAAKL